MKLFGNTSRRKKGSAGGRLLKKILKGITVFVLTLAILGAGIYAAIQIFVEPPEASGSGTVSATSAAGEESEADEGMLNTGNTGWREGVYTFLVAGEDDDNGGTDVIMVGMYDAVAATMNIVSIPRDTIVNVPWDTKKINSYKNMYDTLDADYDSYESALIDGVENIIGYQVDSYVTIDLEGFVALVDAIGGVEFDVPYNMYYSDPAQNLLINMEKGLQVLDGEEAMGVVRYRGYEDGDIERINVQQSLMKAILSDLLQVSNITKVNTLLDIYEEYVNTNLTDNNVAWYVQEILKMDRTNINFHSVGDVSNIYDSVNGVSYVSIYVDPWLEMLNTYLNPYENYEIQADDLDILTRDENGNFYSTSGVMQGGSNWA